MAAPIVNPPLIAGTPSVSTRESWIAQIQSAITQAWTQMHALLSKNLIDTVSPGGTGNAITALIPSDYAEVPIGIGSMWLIEPPAANTGPATLSVGGEAPLPLLTSEGNALPAQYTAAGRRFVAQRRGVGEGLHYRILFSLNDVWPDLVRVGVFKTVSEAGTGNAITAATPAGVQGKFTKAIGQLFLIRPPFTNAGGPVTLSIDGETPARVYDQDNQDPVAGEIVGRRWTLVRYSTSGPQYNLVGGSVTMRQLTALLGGGSGGGGGGDAEPRAEVGAWLDGSTLRAVGDRDGVVANLSTLGLTAVSPPQGGKFAGLVVNRPSLGANTLVGGLPGLGGILIPAAPKVLHIIIVWGQSLAVGADSAASRVTLSQPWPEDALMFDRAVGADVRMGLVTANLALTQVLDPEALTGFRTLVASVGQGPGERGETVLEGCVKRLTGLARQANIQHRTLGIAIGTGSTAYDDLKQGTQSYANMIAAISRAKVLAEARGWRAIVDCVIVKHGEADSGNSGYAADLAELQADVDADFKAVTGQAADVHLFVAPPSSFGANTDAVRAMTAADGPLIHVVGADYAYADAYFTDFVHFNGAGYQLRGEDLAIAIRDQLWGAGYKATKMTGASRSGTTVTLAYQVPSPPLAIDTVSVTDPGQRGFQFFAGGTEIPITAVTVTDTGAGDGVGAIQLTLASAPAGGAERVDYALRLQTAPKTLAGVPRGCVRDSLGAVSQYDGRPINRWAPHQRVTL